MTQSRLKPNTHRRTPRSAEEDLWIRPIFDYARILDLANDTIMIRDLKDEIIYWNQGAERLYGWSKKEALGKHVHTFLKTKFPETREMIFAVFLETGYWKGFLQHSKKDGALITVSSRWTLQRSKDGTPAAYLEINNDVTAQREIEQDLQRARRELEERVAERTAELEQTNALLREQVEERRLAELALRDLSLRLISAQESERRRISSDLHDDLGQILTYITMDLERALSTDNKIKKNGLTKRVLEAGRKAHARLREISSDLRPPVLDDLGLRAAIRTYLVEFAQQTGIGMDIDVSCYLDGIPEIVATSVYRILQEALTNVAKHARARRVSIAVRSSTTTIDLEVQDDGIGFDKETASSSHGWGLSGMTERAELLGGSLFLESVKGQGTTVLVQIPIVTGA